MKFRNASDEQPPTFQVVESRAIVALYVVDILLKSLSADEFYSVAKGYRTFTLLKPRSGVNPTYTRASHLPEMQKVHRPCVAPHAKGITT
ncbi:MAG TPA: hypothetical protein VL728_08820 [Cyclobacteriaceae bacterium]|jgi:hypothetical protein|nr:hypothetical protein [Cyclobacteriaceae bacterium]